MPPPDYPFADRDEITDVLHGHKIADPYPWIEDRSDVRTIQWEAVQDVLAEPILADLPGRSWLTDRITELAQVGAVGVPVWRGERAFFTRREPGQEHAVLLLREPDGQERPLIDPGALDPSGLTTLDAWSPSIEGDRLAYQLSIGGDEESQLHVIDVATGEALDGPIDRCRYSPIAWLPGGSEFFYVRRLAPELLPEDERQFHRRVYRHPVGGDADVEIHGAGLEMTNYYGVRTSRDGRWLVISASQGTAPRDDVWIADLAGDATPREVQVGVDAQWLDLEFHDDQLFVLTDRDAPRRHVVRIDPSNPSYDAWQVVLPEQESAVLADFTVLDGPTLLATHSVDATDRLSTWRNGTKVTDIPTPSAGTIAGVTSHPDGGATGWVGYTDFTTPGSVLEWSIGATAPRTWASAPSQLPLDGIVVTEEHCESADGTPIHLFILSKPGSGPRPTVLYGYGGFNISLTPDYAASRIAWVEAGGVWAIANLRGGSEHGEEWHRAGMRANKQNVFDDFAAAARHVVAAGWTTREQLAVFGGSNGGLLVGAAVTQFPELFTAAICGAPLLDMVRYEQFGLGRTWNDEYGSADKPEELAWLVGYSPYHRVVEGTAYPAMLFVIFDSDTRVDPVHARKLCAALQYATSGDGPILVRREADVGHGARSVTRTVGRNVDELAFLGAQVGLRFPEQ